MTNWEECGRKLLWLKLSFGPCKFLEKLKKTMKILVRIIVPAEI
jgi:hypothetical protein